MHSRALHSLGLLGSALAFAVAAHWLDPQGVLAALRQLSPGWVLAGLAVTALQAVLFAARWRYTAGRLGAPLTAGRAVAEYYRSLWWNQALPFGVGGDALRALRHAPEAGHKLAIQALVLERLSGQVVLWCGALLAAGWLWGWSSLPRLSLWAAGAVVTVALASRVRRLRDPIREARHALIDDGALAVQLMLSGALLASHVALFACGARALGVTLPWPALCAVVPLMLGATTLPLAFAGWGVRELSTAALFGALGLPTEQGAAAGLAFGLLALVGAVPGLLLSAADRLREALPATEAEALGRASLIHAAGMLGALALCLWLDSLQALSGIGCASLMLMALALRELAGRSLGLANAITGVRLAAVLWLGSGATVHGSTLAAVGLAVFCLDGLDGWWARRSGTTSSYGAWFDMETDALFVLALGCALAPMVGWLALVPGAWRYAYLPIARVAPARREQPRSRLARYAFGVMVSLMLTALLPVPTLRLPLVLAATTVVSASFMRSLYWSYRTGV